MHDRGSLFAPASIAVLGLALALGTAGGCQLDPRALPAGAEGMQVNGNGGHPGGSGGAPGDPNDPFGICLTDQHDFGWFDCSTHDTTCTGWGSTTCGSGGCVSTDHAVCDHTCQTAADCPIPATGNVHPICHPYVHACQLPCDANSTCPDGLTCQSTAEWGLSDAAGNRIPPPFQCMQTLTATDSDGGRP